MAQSLCPASATAAGARASPCFSRPPALLAASSIRQRQRGVACNVGAGWLAGQVAGVGVAAAAAWLLSRQPAEEQQEPMETLSRRPCPSCGGTGYEECACTRWSDGDVGCNSCSHTGYTKCRSCGGRGTAVPIKVSIRKNDTL